MLLAFNVSDMYWLVEWPLETRILTEDAFPIYIRKIEASRTGCIPGHWEKSGSHLGYMPNLNMILFWITYLRVSYLKGNYMSHLYQFVVKKTFLLPGLRMFRRGLWRLPPTSQIMIALLKLISLLVNCGRRGRYSETNFETSRIKKVLVHYFT